MRGLSRRLALTALGVVVFGALVAFGAGAAGAKPGHDRPADRVVLFASDGMRPDLMEKYAKAGAMPTYKKLMKDGATGDNGMLQAFPPNTGVGWYTMATGTYPSEHGSTNNTYFRSGDALHQPDVVLGRGRAAGRHDRERRRARGQEGRADRLGRRRRTRTSNGPTVDFTNFFSNRGVLVGAANAVEQAGCGFFGVTYQVASVRSGGRLDERAGRRSGGAAKETTWTIASTFAAQNPNRVYNVYFYDSVADGGVNYDHAIVSPVGKTGTGCRSTSRSATSARSS